MTDSDLPITAAATPPLQSPPQSLGEMLRAARLAHDLTLEQLSTELRIEAKQLKALEENRFEQIGVPVFVKGYLKQYGLRLGIDVRELLALYHKQTTLADVEVQPSRSIKLHDERQITSWVVLAIVLVLVVVLAYWWWTGGNLGSLATRSAPAGTAATAPAAIERTTQPGVQPVEQTPAAAPSPVVSDAAVPANPASATPAPLDATAVAGGIVEPGRDGDDGLAATVAAMPLELTFAAESWAEVTDARGERLLFGLTPAGRNVTLQGAPPFAVVLGNAAAVQIIVDGEPYVIPTTGREGELARFSVNVAGD